MLKSSSSPTSIIQSQFDVSPAHLPSRRSLVLCWLLGLSSLAAGLPTLVVEGVLNGPAVMNGSARGTAVVVIVVALPLLYGGLARARRGSVRGWAAVLGALGYLTYNAVMFVFATPFNELFLLYVAMLGFAVWSMVSVIIDAPVPGPVSDHLPARTISGFMLILATLNAVAWFMFTVPELDNADNPAFLEGTGLTTNPVYIQDLAIWIPAMSIAAVMLWRRRPWGGFLSGAGLVFWFVESVGVAVDQLFGHWADRVSDVATAEGAVMFAVLAVITAIPLCLWLRNPVAAGEE